MRREAFLVTRDHETFFTRSRRKSGFMSGDAGHVEKTGLRHN